MSRRKIPGGWKPNKDGTRSWVLTYRKPDTGKQAQKSFRGKGAKERAERFYDEIVAAGRTGVYAPPEAGKQTFRDFATEWADTEQWAPSTRAGFESQLNRLDRFLGDDVRLDQVDERALKRLRQRLVEEYQHSTATITLNYACQIMRAAHRQKRVPTDVTVDVSAPKDRSGRPKGTQPADVPTRVQVDRILNAAPDEWKAGVALMAAGLRVSEMLGARAEQYDRASRTFVVDQQVNHDGSGTKLPKRDKVRTIVLPDWAAGWVDHHLDEFQGAGLLFRNRFGEPRRRDVFYAQVWYPTLDRAGVPSRIKCHALRHWCASKMLSDGASLPAVAGHIGDRVDTLLDTYAHWLPDDRGVPAAVLDGVLSAPSDVAERRENVEGALTVVRSLLDRPPRSA